MDEIDVSQERDFKSRKPGLMKKVFSLRNVFAD